MVIRRGQKKDMSYVLSLIKELAIFEKEPDAVIIDSDYLVKNAFSTPPVFYTYVAEVENEIIGMALFYYRFSTWKGTTIHLEDLIVKQEKRGIGIGKALYNKVLKFAYNQNVKRVEWVVLDWNKNAIDFYKNTGATILKDWYTVQMDDSKLHSYLKSQKIID